MIAPVVLALTRAQSLGYLAVAAVWLALTVLVFRTGMRRDGRAGELLVTLGVLMALTLFFGYAGLLYLRA